MYLFIDAELGTSDELGDFAHTIFINWLISLMSKGFLNKITSSIFPSKGWFELCPAIIIGELPIEYKYLSTKTDLIMNGRKFYLKNHLPI